jgi:nucleoside-diphosphate-sugar epimerase
MARVLIAGCGDVGGRLGALLVADGHAVVGLRRDAARVPAGIEPLAGDLGDPASLAGLTGRFDAVIYSATSGESSDDAYRRTYVDGQRHLAGALERAGAAPARWLFTSSTSVYGQRDGEWVDEDSPTAPAGFSGRRMLEAEAVAHGLAGRGVAVRFGGIYGPGRTWLIERVRAGAPCADDPPVYTNRIHRDDCAGVLRHLLGLEDPAPVYLAVDSAPAPQCEVMDWLAGRLGVARPPRAAGASSRGSKRCRNDRLLASGYRLLYPTYRDGYAALLAG